MSLNTNHGFKNYITHNCYGIVYNSYNINNYDKSHND